MAKELVAVKNREYWDIILDVSLSEGKNLTEESEVIKIISNNINLSEGTSFIVEDIEIFAICEIETINPGNACKL